MKQVLLISYYFPPSGGSAVQRILKFVRYLPEFGWNTTVLTVDTKCAAFPALDTELLDQIPASTRVVRTKAWDPYAMYARLQGLDKNSVVSVGFAQDAGSNLRRRAARWIRGNVFLPDARVGWYPFALRQAKALMSRTEFDVIMTSGPPHSTHLVGRWVRKNCAVPWVVDIRDPWTEGYFSEEIVQSRLARRLDKRMERHVLTGADAVISVSEGLGRWVRREGLARRYQTITNGFDPQDLPKRRVGSRRSKSFVIAHFGTLNKLRHSPGLIRAMQRLAGKHEIELHLVGSVDDSVVQDYRRAGLGNSLRLVPFMPRSKALEAMSEADLLLVAVQRLNHFHGELTGKLFEYLGIGVPILGIARPTSELASILRNTGGGKAFDHEDEAGVASYVLSHITRVAKGEELPPRNTQVIRSYERRELTRQLARLFDSLVMQAVN